METTENTKTDLRHTQTDRLLNGNKCGWKNPLVGSGGSNIKFGQRSKTVNNPKDAYGFRAMSPYKASRHERVQPMGSSEMVWKGYPCTPWTKFEGFPGGMERWFPGMLGRMSVVGEQSTNLLAMRAEAGLKQQDINVLQFAAFLPSTLKSIHKNLTKMDSLLDILHDKRKLMQQFKGTEWKSLYLQWLFVWNQLHRDVVGGAAFLKKQSRPIGSLVTGRARANWSDSFEDSAYPYAWSQIGKAVCVSNVTVGQRAVSVARVTCDVSYTYNALGIDNPMYLFWDLIRWSWVIDQVIDIGLFIQSITSLHGLEHLGTSVTRRAENTSIVTVEGFTDRRGRFTVNPKYSPGFSTRKTVERLVRNNPTRNISLRNPFQNSVAVTAAVAAAVGLKMQNTNIDPILRRA